MDANLDEGDVNELGIALGRVLMAGDTVVGESAINQQARLDERSEALALASLTKQLSASVVETRTVCQDCLSEASEIIRTLKQKRGSD